MKRQLEVLAPAGDLKTLRTAVIAGADAVYFGGESFGARAYAANFSFKDAEQGIEFAHSRGARTYLTVNTLLKSLEIEKQVYDYLKDYYNAGIDAVLVQDIGLMQLIRAYFPELHLHISTQANVTSEYGALFFKNLGASRVVLARELSLKEIKQIHDNVDIELECFAHGALCVSYSGQCLMSSMIGGRSGNRGRCAQPCRKCYDLLDSARKKRGVPGKYPISMKDLCTIEDVKALYDAGCSSLKIEGRMKSQEYVGAVVSAYRQIADEVMDGREPDDAEMIRDAVLHSGTRGGGTDGYLHRRNGADMITFTDSSFLSVGPSSFFVKEKKTRAASVFTARVGKPLSITISDGKREIRVEGPVAERARKPGNVTEEIKDKIVKTGDERIEITDVSVDADSDVFVPMSLVKGLRREAVQRFLGGITIDRGEPLSFEPMKPQKNNGKNDDRMLVTCMTGGQLEVASAFLRNSDIIGINYDLYSLMNADDIAGLCQKKYLCLPEILRSDKLPQMDADLFDGFIVSSYDEIEYVHERYPAKPVIFDYRLYSWSDRSRKELISFGAEYICAPLELNEKELSHLDESSSFICVYGRTPVMYMANCSHKNSVGCDKRREVLYLRDERKADFPVINLCSSCTNVIYNSLPTSLIPFAGKISEMGFAGFRFDFTIEKTDEVSEVLNTFQKNIKENASEDIMADVTRGHFHRGVS